MKLGITSARHISDLWCYTSCDEPHSEAHCQVGQDGGVEDLGLRKWWRGRMGMSKEEQVDAFQRCSSTTRTEHAKPAESAAAATWGGASQRLAAAQLERQEAAGEPSSDQSSSSSGESSSDTDTSSGSSSDEGPEDLK